MRVIVHCGAHHTEEDRLLKCLLQNKEELAKRRISVPGPGRYRPLLKDAFIAMDAAEPAPGARDVLIDAILDEEECNRMILSNSHFFGSPRFALNDGQLYPLATRRLRQLKRLFDGDQIELFMAVCNPATFLPNLLSKASSLQQREIIEANAPRTLRWSELFQRVRHVVPDVSITVWCNEDSPMIWSDLIRNIAGFNPGEQVVGGFDLLRDIMSSEGMQRFRAYLSDHPNLTDAQKRRVIAAFLSKYALDEALEEELDLPGWTDALVDELTGLYEQDMVELQNIEGVRFIAA
ncbi:MAG: hypothetical protein AB3N13_08995 [Arenibacterium sp.]